MTVSLAGTASFSLIILVFGFASPAAAQFQWGRYIDERGTSIEYPTDLFVTPERPEIGNAYVTRDRRARIHMYSMANPKGLAPAKFMQKHFPTNRSVLSYDRVSRNFFAISTRLNGMIVYMRCNFSRSSGGALHCVDIRYPEREKRAWDRVVTRISHSVRPATAR